MKKNILMIIGVVIIILSVVFAAFTDVANDIPALIGTAFGLGLEIFATWKKSEKKGGLTIVSIICAVVGGLCCAFAGLGEKTLSSLVVAVAGLVALLVSIFTSLATNKKTETTGSE